MDITLSDLVKKYGENAFRDYGSHVNLAHMKSNLFDPVKYGLDPGFRLTNFTDLKGCGCKVPRDQLLKLLEGLTASPPLFAASQRKLNANGDSGRNDAQNGAQSATGGSKTAFDASLSAIGEERIDIFSPLFFSGSFNSIKIFPLGIGLDSCLIPLRHAGLYLVQTTDFFYPLVDDPYLMVGFFHIIWLTLSIDWLFEWLFDCSKLRLIDWLIDWLGDWLIEHLCIGIRLIDWLIEHLCIAITLHSLPSWIHMKAEADYQSN